VDVQTSAILKKNEKIKIYLPIKQWQQDDRTREKLFRNVEHILATLSFWNHFEDGSKKRNALDLARNIIQKI